MAVWYVKQEQHLFIRIPVSVLFFAHSYENESLVPKHHHNRPPTKPSNGRSRSSTRYDVPVNDLAIAVVFYERHLLLLNQMTVFFDCPVNELNFLYPKVKRLWITCEAGDDNVVCFITVKYFRVESWHRCRVRVKLGSKRYIRLIIFKNDSLQCMYTVVINMDWWSCPSTSTLKWWGAEKTSE